MCPPARLLAYANTPLPPLRALKRRARNAPGLGPIPFKPPISKPIPAHPQPPKKNFDLRLFVLTNVFFFLCKNTFCAM